MNTGVTVLYDPCETNHSQKTNHPEIYKSSPRIRNHPPKKKSPLTCRRPPGTIHSPVGVHWTPVGNRWNHWTFDSSSEWEISSHEANNTTKTNETNQNAWNCCAILSNFRGFICRRLAFWQMSSGDAIFCQLSDDDTLCWVSRFRTLLWHFIMVFTIFSELWIANISEGRFQFSSLISHFLLPNFSNGWKKFNNAMILQGDRLIINLMSSTIPC